MVNDLIKKGTLALKSGDLESAKSLAKYLGAYLDIYVPSEKEWAKINTFLQEVMDTSEGKTSKKNKSPKRQDIRRGQLAMALDSIG